MSPTIRRRLRWALRGALVLAALAILLGGMFTIVITIAAGDVPPGAGLSFWASRLLLSSLIWGGGAIFFGAPLGMYASMIWRDDS